MRGRGRWTGSIATSSGADATDVASQSDVSTEDEGLVAALRRGDERVFSALVDQYHTSMVRVARSYVATKEAAEDVAQDAWVGVLQGLDRFEGRSSLKTWMFRIVINKAMTRGARDARTVPFSSVGHGSMHAVDLGADEPVVDPSRFQTTGRWAGHWASPPAPWDEPERALVSQEARAMIDTVISTLPPSQRLVVTLRDIQGMGASETCDLLGLSEANQRVLLHRARAKIRAALDDYLGTRVEAAP